MAIARQTIEMNPFFSVVIPVFNKEIYISQTIDSVLKQTFKNFELILVVDPCTDRTLEVIKGFDDQRIRIFQRNSPGPGGYEARNLGIKNSKTNWIAFLDADDTWQELYLERMFQAIDKYPDHKVFCCGYQVEAAGSIIPAPFFAKYSLKQNMIIDFQQYLEDKPICAINVVVNKSLMREIDGFPEGKFKRGGDNETWLRMMNAAREAVWVNYLGATWNRLDMNSVTRINEHYTFHHPVRYTVIKLRKLPENRHLSEALTSFSNNFVVPGVKAKAARGNLRLFDLRAIFITRKILRVKIIYLLLIFSLLPFSVQKKLINVKKDR